MISCSIIIFIDLFCKDIESSTLLQMDMEMLALIIIHSDFGEGPFAVESIINEDRLNHHHLTKHLTVATLSYLWLRKYYKQKILIFNIDYINFAKS